MRSCKSFLKKVLESMSDFQRKLEAEVALFYRKASIYPENGLIGEAPPTTLDIVRPRGVFPSITGSRFLQGVMRPRSN